MLKVCLFNPIQGEGGAEGIFTFPHRIFVIKFEPQ